MKKGINAAIAAVLVLAVAGAGYYAYSYNASGMGKRGPHMQDGRDFHGKMKQRQNQKQGTRADSSSSTHL